MQWNRLWVLIYHHILTVHHTQGKQLILATAVELVVGHSLKVQTLLYTIIDFPIENTSHQIGV